ncbi:uncharacterized protein LOC132955939 isoform X3 [Labrus mixtus]|uniref:uncharacterized protein LOC132955939 isoform X3 n=1 Tax=Labrus mixtus TaxID=508554 RepID=UPI0029C0587D|nr:uncharacterized protein LOC132955939 isoform X3 [Labrus mixtus]
MTTRRCFFKCDSNSSLHGLPSSASLRNMWLSFMFRTVPQQYSPNIFLCSRHFIEDCFANWTKFKLGFAKKLILKEGAVPNLFGHDGSSQSQPSTLQTRSSSIQMSASGFNDAGCQSGRDCHMKSKGTRATVSQVSTGTEPVCTGPQLLLSSTPTDDNAFRPSKRPRLLEVKEEEEGETSAEAEPIRSTFNPDDFIKEESEMLSAEAEPIRSTFNPGVSIKEEYEMFTVGPLVTYGDTKYIVFDSCLRELFETCPVCKRQSEVQRQSTGTLVAFKQLCHNCNYSRKWQSQPIVASTHVGNLELSAATNFTGASFFQLEKVCKAIQLWIFQYDTFRRHARNFLEPANIHEWNNSTLQTTSSSIQMSSSRFNDAGCQTDSPHQVSECTVPPNGSSVGTQLSWGTLRDCHMKSKGTQATVSQVSTGTEPVCTGPQLLLSSTPTDGNAFRPSKRPRFLEVKEEEEGETSAEAEPIRSTFNPDDFIKEEYEMLSTEAEPIRSTFNPDDSIKEESEMFTVGPLVTYGDTKYIVFDSCLRELFETCPVCKRQSEVQRQSTGTLVAFKQLCHICNYSRKWQSQPIVASTHVGNLELSAATNFTGASFFQLAKVCKAIQLWIFQYDTFRRHARNFLEPANIHEWNNDQQVAVGSDMREDSPVWLAVQEELLGNGGADFGAPSCFDEFDDEALFQMFNLSRPCISFILDAARIFIKKLALKNPTLSVDEMVMVALNYYAHGVSSPCVLQRVGQCQTDCLAIMSTVSGVIAGMSDQFISFPLTHEAKKKVAFKTEKLCRIPNVLGVLGAAHFKIRASPYETDTFRGFVNTLGYTSVVSQIICDSDGNILSVEKCCVGSTFEQELWESSFKGREMEEEIHGPFWVIAGKGYNLSKHVLTPVAEPANDSETSFNEAHTKIHDVMRTTLGSMKRRFRCLNQLDFAQENSLAKKSNIIKACSVLHNIAKKFSVPPPSDAGQIEPLHPGKQRAEPDINPEALKARQKLIIANFLKVSRSRNPPSKKTLRRL